MKNTVENNLAKWDQEHGWRKDGDEWTGQAKYCGQPYDAWKSSLVETFIHPNVSSDSDVLEIAPGHGRWSKEMVDRVKHLTLVDLSPSCIDHCKEIFESYDHVDYVVNDGRSLPGVPDGSVDFVWSYDSFVHMDADTIGSYLAEIDRVLKPGGRAIIHHAGRKHGYMWLSFLTDRGPRGKRWYKKLSMERPDAKGAKKFKDDTDGWRSDVSKRIVAQRARNAGLTVEDQLRFWGPNKEFGVPRFGDWITVLAKR